MSITEYSNTAYIKILSNYMVIKQHFIFDRFFLDYLLNDKRINSVKGGSKVWNPISQIDYIDDKHICCLAEVHLTIFKKKIFKNYFQ